MEAAVAQELETDALDWLEPIYREHSKDVLRAAYRVTGSAEDAEDVLQTVFIRLARRTSAPDFSTGAGPYLRRAATNAALDLLRSRKAKSATPLDGSTSMEAVDHRAEPDRLHASSQLRDLLREALASLNQRNAEMFALRYFEDLDNREIAEIFATSPGTVAVTLHRIRSRLMDELHPFLGGIQ